MDWLRELIKSNAHIAISFPAISSIALFLGNLCIYLQDGALDDAEFHKLATSANGVEMVILIIVILAFRKK